MPRVPEPRVRARREARKVHDQAKQEAFERRYRARQLLFTKGAGRMSNLPLADRRFILSVMREAYSAYLHLLRTGQTRYQCGRKWIRANLNRPSPMPERKYWKVWYGSQKARFHRYDLPQSVKANLETQDA